MAKKSPFTTNTQIKSALRRLFLRSRERASALKRDNYTCQVCGKKQSRKKQHEVYVEVHHKTGILNWKELIEQVRLYLLVDPKHMQTLCRSCHKDIENPIG